MNEDDSSGVRAVYIGCALSFVAMVLFATLVGYGLAALIGALL